MLCKMIKHVFKKSTIYIKEMIDFVLVKKLTFSLNI